MSKSECRNQNDEIQGSLFSVPPKNLWGNWDLVERLGGRAIRSTCSSSLSVFLHRAAKPWGATIYESTGRRDGVSDRGRWPRCAGPFSPLPPTDQAGCPRSRTGSTDMHFPQDSPRMNGFSARLNHARDMRHGVDHRNIRGERIRPVPELEPSELWNERFENQRRPWLVTAGTACTIPLNQPSRVSETYEQRRGTRT